MSWASCWGCGSARLGSHSRTASPSSPAPPCWWSQHLWSQVCNCFLGRLEALQLNLFEVWSASNCHCNMKIRRALSTLQIEAYWNNIASLCMCRQMHYTGRELISSEQLWDFRWSFGQCYPMFYGVYRIRVDVSAPSGGVLKLFVFLRLQLGRIRNIFPQCLILISVNRWLFWAVKPLDSLGSCSCCSPRGKLNSGGLQPPQTSHRQNVAAAQVFM